MKHQFAREKIMTSFESEEICEMGPYLKVQQVNRVLLEQVIEKEQLVAQ